MKKQTTTKQQQTFGQVASFVLCNPGGVGIIDNKGSGSQGKTLRQGHSRKGLLCKEY